MDNLCKAIGLIADFLTAILGSLAIWGLIKHRKKINAFVRLLAHNLITERIKKIKGTLARMDSLNYDVKEDRKEIIAILGELAGMTRSLASRHKQFNALYGEMLTLAGNPVNLSESTKRRITEEIHALLDEQGLNAALNLMEESNEPKSD